AYYLVQLRSILEKGSLGFPDMPLYFYFLAGLHRLISWLTSLDSYFICLHLVKFIGAILIPIALIPWYFIVAELRPRRIPLAVEVLLGLMLTCSFTPLLMLGNFQKNAFAISFILGLILWTIRYFKTKKPMYILGITAFFLLILISHFGSLAFSLLLAAITILICQGKKSWFPLLGLGVITLTVLLILDPIRANRLFFIISEIFQRPAIFYSGKPYYILTPISYVILLLGLVYYHQFAKDLRDYERLLIKVCLWVIGIITFPFLEAEYARRLSLMLFIPQALLLFFIWQLPWPKIKKALAISLAVYIGLSVTVIYLIKRPTLSEPIYADLERIETIIKDRKKTMIVARHGLEWWVSWSLGTKVANGWGVHPSLLNKYEPVLFIEQKNNVPLRGLAYFKDPKPKVGKLVEIYSSRHFKVYEWSL
ncbi:MAG: hypothetical protein AAFU64_13950, partial [Bacteroidota bacterium]